MNNTCFPLQNAPAGLAYYPAIITPAESEFLVGQLMQLEFLSHAMRGQRTKRRMHCFGWNYDPQRRALVPAPDPIPDWLHFLRDRCAAIAEASACEFQQAIVTLYGEKDAGIGPHIDAPTFGPIIMGVSLLSAVEMVFAHDDLRLALTLAPRSLYVMKDEARYQWKHAIRQTLHPPRLSVVFRSVH